MIARPTLVGGDLWIYSAVDRTTTQMKMPEEELSILKGLLQYGVAPHYMSKCRCSVLRGSEIHMRVVVPGVGR